MPSPTLRLRRSPFFASYPSCFPHQNAQYFSDEFTSMIQRNIELFEKKSSLEDWVRPFCRWIAGKAGDNHLPLLRPWASSALFGFPVF